MPGDGADEPLVWYEGSGPDRRYLQTDERGSVTEVSDNAGTTLAINQYDEWGIPRAGNLGRFGYTGQTWLPQLNAWNYKARVYHPLLGRFLQTDPIASSANLYAYVGNDPANDADATGLVGEDKIITVTANLANVALPQFVPVVGQIFSAVQLLSKIFHFSIFGHSSKPPAPAQINSVPQAQTTQAGTATAEAEAGDIIVTAQRHTNFLTRVLQTVGGFARSPQNPKPAETPKPCRPVALAVSEGVAQIGTNTSDYGSAIIAAGLVAKNPAALAVGEVSALLGTGIQALGAAGRLLATGNVDRARYDAVGVAFSFFQSQTKAGSLALGYTAGKAVDLHNQLSPGKDCER